MNRYRWKQRIRRKLAYICYRCTVNCQWKRDVWVCPKCGMEWMPQLNEEEPS